MKTIKTRTSSVEYILITKIGVVHFHASHMYQSASSIAGVRTRGRQTRIGGALALPNRLRFERMEYTDLLLHSAAHAI